VIWDESWDRINILYSNALHSTPTQELHVCWRSLGIYNYIYPESNTTTSLSGECDAECAAEYPPLSYIDEALHGSTLPRDIEWTGICDR
jgi:hypothetical protein